MGGEEPVSGYELTSLMDWQLPCSFGTESLKLEEKCLEKAHLDGCRALSSLQNSPVQVPAPGPSGW